MSWCYFFKQKTVYELRISDLSSDVCSSDLLHHCSSQFCNIIIVDKIPVAVRHYRFGTAAASCDHWPSKCSCLGKHDSKCLVATGEHESVRHRDVMLHLVPGEHA